MTDWKRLLEQRRDHSMNVYLSMHTQASYNFSKKEDFYLDGRKSLEPLLLTAIETLEAYEEEHQEWFRSVHASGESSCGPSIAGQTLAEIKESLESK